MARQTGFEPPLRSALERLKSLPTSVSTVSDVMTRSLVSLPPHMSFQEAIGLMTSAPFRHFLVVDADKKLIGVLSDRDLLRVLARTPEWQKTKIADAITRSPVTVRPDTPLSAAVIEILVHRINCLPVVDADKTVRGIVTTTDMMMALLKLQECQELADWWRGCLSQMPGDPTDSTGP